MPVTCKGDSGKILKSKTSQGSRLTEHVAHAEVQGIGFVGSTGSEGSKPRLWNLQNLCPVLPYTRVLVLVLEYQYHTRPGKKHPKIGGYIFYGCPDTH